MYQQLRKAGSAFRQFDEEYGRRLGNFITGGKDGRINAVTGPLAVLASAPVTRRATDIVEHSPTDPRWVTAFGKAAEYGIPAAAAGIRYGIPAYALTTAGRDLLNLMVGIGSPADSPQPSEIQLHVL